MYRYKLIAQRAAVPLVIVALTFANAFLWYQLGAKQSYEAQKDAYGICMASHHELSGGSEEACGAALDKTHTEFMCGNYDCWLEVK